MIGYTGNPHAEHDRSYYAKERADVEFGRCVEFQVDSLMIDCLESEDAASLIHENDLQETDLLRDLMVVAARADGGSLTHDQAVTEMRRVLRAAFTSIARKECDK